MAMGRRGRGRRRCAVRLSHARRRGTSSGRASFAQPEGITFPVLHGPHVSARGPTTVSPDRARRHMRVPAPHVPMQYLLPPMLHLVRTPATMLLRRFALCALVLCVCALRVLALYVLVRCVLGRCVCAGACPRTACRRVSTSRRRRKGSSGTYRKFDLDIRPITPLLDLASTVGCWRFVFDSQAVGPAPPWTWKEIDRGTEGAGSGGGGRESDKESEQGREGSPCDHWWAPDPLMGWWDSACASHPGVLGSIPKRWAQG